MKLTVEHTRIARLLISGAGLLLTGQTWQTVKDLQAVGFPIGGISSDMAWILPDKMNEAGELFQQMPVRKPSLFGAVFRRFGERKVV